MSDASIPGTAAGTPRRWVGAEGSAPPGARAVAVAVAVVAAVLVWVVWRFFVGTYAGQAVEQAAFDGATYGQGWLWSIFEPVLDVVSVAFVVAGIGTSMAIALVRRRWGLAIQVAVLVGGANLTTQVLKHWVFDRENLIGGWSGGNTLPSGHTTVAASVAVALLVVVPRGLRPVVAVLGGAYAGVTGVATLVGQWHRPSDVVAALLVVLAWGALVLAWAPGAALDSERPGPPGTPQRPVGPGSWITAVVLIAGGGAALVGAAWSLGQVHAAPAWEWPTVTAYAGGVLGVLGTTALVFAVLLVLRQATGYRWRTAAALVQPQ